MDVSAICRLCMKGSSVGMEPIFTPVMGDCLATKIAGVTQLMLYEGDGLPANACQQCIFKLDIADNFIQKCILSDNAIRATQSAQITYRAPTRDEENVDNRHLVEPQHVYQTALDANRATSPLRFELEMEPPKGGNENLSETAIQTFTFEETVQSNSPAVDESGIGLFEEMDCASESDPVASNESDQALQTNSTAMESMAGNDESKESDEALQTNSTAKESMTGNDEIIASAKHSCGMCDRLFDTPLGLRNHSVSHFGKRPMLSCDSCPRKYSRIKDLNLHTLRAHGGKKVTGSFECNICQKTFRAKKTLKEHIFRHFVEKPLNCTRRDKGSAKTTVPIKALKDPMRVLSNDRPHICVLCKETFKRKVTLKSHVEQHCRP